MKVCQIVEKIIYIIFLIVTCHILYIVFRYQQHYRENRAVLRDEILIEGTMEGFIFDHEA